MSISIVLKEKKSESGKIEGSRKQKLNCNTLKQIFFVLLFNHEFLYN